MQTQGITLSEFNDESINLAITQNGSAFNLAGVTVDMFFKANAGDSDSAGSTLKLSSGGGSPAITITNAAGGLATATLASSFLQSEPYNFYRVDVVVSGLRSTCVYGAVSWVTL